MNRCPRQIDEVIDAHLGLYADAPAGDMQQAQERARLRLLEETQRLPERRPLGAGFTWSRTFVLASAALAVFVLTIQTPGIRRVLTTSSGLAAANSAGGDLYRESGTRLAQGDPIARSERVRSRTANAQLVMADGSLIEMRANSELSLEPADDGMTIRLGTGSIIVNAAKQHGHLYVTTKDVLVSVVGTVFLVNAESDGSSVGVIEGEVHVREGAVETSLRPGQQVSTNRKIVARPLREAIAWSGNADAIRAILANFEKGMAMTAGPLKSAAEKRRVVEPGGAQSGAVAAAGSEFDEASIKPCDPNNVPEPPAGARGGGANSFQMTPGRTHALCLTLATLIRTAYGYAPANFFSNGGRSPGFNFNNVYGLGVEDGQRVRGGPDWVRRDSYTIDAVAPDAADAATMSGPMLRALLEKRFHLQAHIETEQIPAFDLTIAAGGLKMKEGVCTPDPSFVRTAQSTNAVIRKNLEAARRGATTTAPCGMAFAANGANALAVGAGAGVPSLSGVFGVPVTDRTGIPTTARFNYALEFSLDETMAGPLARVLTGGIPGPDVQIASDPSGVPPAPSLFTAVEQQLGLHLEPSRAPREFIVIDRVDRPTAD